MNRVAIVVQRCHEEIVGGSESLAWQYATLLKDAYEVDVLTTTALDTTYWINALPEGLDERDGVNIRRFKVTTGRSNPYWGKLHHRLTDSFNTFAVGRRRAVNGDCHLRWSVPLQEEFILHQGPHSESLLQFLREHWRDYHALIFVTYLYPTTYFGLLQLPAGRALLAPTLHDEQPAYLSAYKHAAERARALIWLTEAERRVARKLWGELPGRVVAMSIDTELRRPARLKSPYLVYCGRIDPNKGCRELFKHFIKYKAYHPSKLRLVLTGKDDLDIPAHPDIEFRGFVSDEEKFRLMAGALLYLMPSPNESFSIVTLEAMAQQTPVLASGISEVLVDHLGQSGAGLIYRDYESFARSLNELLPDKERRARMGAAGREYVLSNYQPERIRASLIEVVEACASEPTPPRTIEPRIEPVKAGRAMTKSNQNNLLNAPPLPLPPGWSEAELREWTASVLVEGGPPAEMRAYAVEDFKRFVYTLGLVPDKPGLDVLELGANPYFTTTLLYKFRDARLHLANFFGHAEKEAAQTVTVGQTGEVIAYTYRQFNIEEDAFPYEDNSLDVVLFCEIIEHLLADPVHALVEIRRVLKPGGTLVITTPNVARLDNVCKLIGGENIYDPYSGYGPYGRHNREYNKHDLYRLLTANGFHVNNIFTADVHERYADSYVDLERIKPLVAHRAPDLGQYIFCQSTVAEEASPPVRPDWLYRSYQSSPERLSSLEDFRRRFENNLRDCQWEPHPLYSAFTQYDQEYYLQQKEAFLHKYRCFYAVSRTISPPSIIELGVLAGSSADAYLSAAPGARYTGIDEFGVNRRHDDQSLWNPLEVAERLFKARGFKNYELIQANLRSLSTLPRNSYMVVVDAAHDFDNEYADLRLALTADPTFIFVDDIDDETQAKPAVDKFLREDLKGRIDFVFRVSYFGGGIVIKLKK